MKYATAGAFRTALERRLLTRANQTGIPLVRLRKLVVFDRLLARLLIAAPDRWILKGALALDYRWGYRFRMTKDLDLSRHDSEKAATRDFVAAQSVDLDDHFTFVIQKTAKLDQALEGAAVRYHVSANLAGRRFEDGIVDVGFRDPLFSIPEILSGPDLLGFADIDAAAVPAIPIEQHIAEKVHACTRVYTGQRQSSRVKDLIDLVLIQEHAIVNAGRLRTALDLTFTSRDTHTLPAEFPAPPRDWEPAYRRLAGEVELSQDIQTGYQTVAAFLNSVLSEDISNDATWNPAERRWVSRSPRD